MYHLPDSTSDHSALLVSAHVSHRQTRAKRFHFEAMWTKNADCKSIIENCWGMNLDLSTPEGVMANLSSCAAKLSKWSSNVFWADSKEDSSKKK